MLARAALAGIAGYQRWVSPRKGYGCAYRLVHGGTGCSGFAKAAIAKRGLRPALPLIRTRLADCREAAVTLRRRRRDGEERQRNRWYDGYDGGCAAVDCDCTGCIRLTHLDDVARGCDCTPDCCGF